MSCYCEYEPSSVYVAKMHTARKQHKCDECCRIILVGERYERVFGVWDGEVDRYKTCPRCLALRNHAKENIKCLCWSHGNMIEDCIEAIKEYAHELPGMLFKAYRMQVLIKKNTLFSKAIQGKVN